MRPDSESCCRPASPSRPCTASATAAAHGPSACTRTLEGLHRGSVRATSAPAHAAQSTGVSSGACGGACDCAPPPPPLPPPPPPAAASGVCARGTHAARVGRVASDAVRRHGAGRTAMMVGAGVSAGAHPSNWRGKHAAIVTRGCLLELSRAVMSCFTCSQKEPTSSNAGGLLDAFSPPSPWGHASDRGRTKRAPSSSRCEGGKEKSRISCQTESK
mmetsp:Transcript_23773/g.59485  ORF Transcript_23773/g.59485 Transcript_23773/m.59485 type:complete len:216 (+) Transcript_23773:1855-2502(+)